MMLKRGNDCHKDLSGFRMKGTCGVVTSIVNGNKIEFGAKALNRGGLIKTEVFQLLKNPTPEHLKKLREKYSTILQQRKELA